jgi:hypothetical protein
MEKFRTVIDVCNGLTGRKCSWTAAPGEPQRLEGLVSRRLENESMRLVLA